MEKEMHAEQETEMARVGDSEAVEYLDEAGEAALDRVAVLCGMTYGDVIRAYYTINRELLGLSVIVERCEASDKDDVSYEPGEPITVRVHSVDLIDEMHYSLVYDGELRSSAKLKNRDGDRRKGWQTCHGPVQRAGKRDRHCFKGRPGRNCIK